MAHVCYLWWRELFIRGFLGDFYGSFSNGIISSVWEGLLRRGSQSVEVAFLQQWLTGLLQEIDNQAAWALSLLRLTASKGRRVEQSLKQATCFLVSQRNKEHGILPSQPTGTILTFLRIGKCVWELCSAPGWAGGVETGLVCNSGWKCASLD